MLVSTKIKMGLYFGKEDMQPYQRLPIPDMIHKVLKDKHITSKKKKFGLTNYIEHANGTVSASGILTTTIKH